MTDRADIPDEELIATAIAGALLDVHTALPGIVKKYDASKGVCDVQPAVKRALEREDGTIATESLPVIPNVRVCWPGAGGYELHFPLAAGDTVWLMFAEADMQKWESTGQESPPGWLERHGLGSLVAYPFSRKALATTGGARLVAPAPFTVGNLVSAQLVALAPLVAAELAKIAATLLTGSSGGGPVVFGTPYSPSDVAATKLKAE